MAPEPFHHRHDPVEDEENVPADPEDQIVAVRKVRRQNRRGLENREQKHGDHDRRQNEHDFPHDSHDEEQRRERDDRREDRRDDARKHFIDPVHGGVMGGFAHLPVRVNVFSDHDRVVHHDPEAHDQGERRDHVQRLVHRHQYEARAQQRERDPK